MKAEDFLSPEDLEETCSRFGTPVSSKSRLWITCLGCKNGREISCLSMKRYLSRGRPNPTFCGPCCTRENWKKSEYRAARPQRKQKTLLTSEQRSTLQSERSKKMWANPTFRSVIGKAWDDETRRRVQSEVAKGKWEDPGHREKCLAIWQDPNVISAFSIRSKELFGDPEFKANWKNKTWDLSEYRDRVSSGVASFLTSGKDSSIEVTTQELLTSLGIEWERQFKSGPWTFDLHLPNEKVLIECQGEYWHSRPEAKSRDASKFTYVNEYLLDHRILYLHERDFLNAAIVRGKIVAFLSASGPISIPVSDFSLSDVSIRECSISDRNPNSHFSIPEEFFRAFHYAQYGRSAKKLFGAFLGDKLVALCKFSSPGRKESATSLGFAQSQILELDRFCIHPSYQKKNFASWFLSRASNAVFESYHQVQALISFSDSTVGHHGTIYRASNWNEVGTVPPDYHYVSSDGFVVHKKTLWNHSSKNGLKESDFAVQNGYTKVFGKSKTKFLLERKP